VAWDAPPNGLHNPLGGCGVNNFANQSTSMRVRNLKGAPISQVAFLRWLAQPLAFAQQIRSPETNLYRFFLL